jgi:CO/xanthine dehydrogenase FAD-binding subunit
MSLWQQYLRPKTIAEAMQALITAPKPVIPIAGGTDLLLDLEQGRHAPVNTLLDVTGIKELLSLEIRSGRLFIGAGVSVNHITLNSLVNQHAQALIEACELIGGPQVRNVATLGGNTAHALPAADGTIALLALDATVEIAAATGNRELTFSEIFLGPGKSILKHGEEIIVGFYLQIKEPGQASCFKRIMRPQGVALPIINLAVWLDREADTIKNVRIAVGPGAPTPWRARKAEKFLIGKSMNESLIQSALDALLDQVGFRSSPRRANSDYRRHLVASLFKDTLQTAWQRAV